MKRTSIIRLSVIVVAGLLSHACSKHDLSGCRKSLLGSNTFTWNAPWNGGVVFNPANDSAFACLRNNTIYLFNLSDGSASPVINQLSNPAEALVGWCNNNKLALCYGGRFYSSNPDGTSMTLQTEQGSLPYVLPFTCARPISVSVSYGGPGSPLRKDQLLHYYSNATYSLIDTLYDIANYSVNADGRLAVAYNSKFVNLYNIGDQLILSHRLIAEENLAVYIRALCWVGSNKLAWADDEGIYLTDTDTWATTLLQAAHDDAEYLNLSSSPGGLFLAATYKTYYCDHYTQLLENGVNPELHIINTQTGEDKFIGNY